MTSGSITGLVDNTIYDIYVRAVCGVDDTSGFTGTLTFNTLCLALDSETFCENFEDTSSSEACWAVFDSNGDGETWNINSTLNPFTGTRSAEINTDFNDGANDDWLISPNLTIGSNQGLNF